MNHIDNKMNICLIIPNTLPVPATKGGAIETIVTNLLKENEKTGLINFTCVSIYEEEAEKMSKEFKNTKFIYIKQEKRNLDLNFEQEDVYLKEYIDKLYEKIKDKDFDFIIIEGGEISGYSYLLKRFPKEKCLVHIHGDGKTDNNINKEIYNKFLAVSKYTYKVIMKDGIIDIDKIKLLYNAIQLSDFDKKISDDEKIALRKKYGIKEEDIVILFSGRTIPQKGIKELITSFKKIRNIDKCKLLIAGSASFGEGEKTEFEYELEEISKEIQDKIIFTGFISNKDLYKIHNISDIAVVPSMWEEVFGLVVVEAMTSGLPLIVTKSGGIPEIVDNECAIVLDKDEMLIDNMAKELDYLIENPETRKKMGAHGKIRAKKFGMEDYLNNFYRLMQEIKNEG